MEVIKNPWKERLMTLIKESEKSIQITSPFVKENICREIFELKNKGVSFELITSFNLSNAYNGALDLSGLDLIIQNKGIIKNYPKLHSKIYIFDSKRAIITSGNLTNGGLLTNYEYGILFDEVSVVKEVEKDFENIAKNEITGSVTNEHIRQASIILSKIPKIEKITMPTIEIEHKETSPFVLEDVNESISSTLRGWKLSVFKCVDAIQKQEFVLQDIYLFEKELQKIYPENNNVRAKIRQQIQFLRDLGLIEFLSNDGKYRKLWK
ncbi:MAG: phospholipase D-like domain-containing protein [Chitinophagales bacterium]|nr:NgoFVII family restriction endonuclease [Bacteroidota bacterium]MCB9043045.1 NgoFVII family restriction endonuclease [Chitinophagales bacterium]